MKILVFTTFFSRVIFYYFTTIKTGQISKKKRLVFGSGYHNCCNFLQATLQGHYMYALNNSFFDPIGIKSTLPDFSTFMS